MDLSQRQFLQDAAVEEHREEPQRLADNAQLLLHLIKGNLVLR
jgi:hypothetical protein